MPTSASNKTTASLICVGSELLRGHLNTHASTLGHRLLSIGITLLEEQTVGDDQDLLSRVIRQALQKSSVVIVTGGLGPTFDDLTREAAADACGKRMFFSRPLLQAIDTKFRQAGRRRMPPTNRRQAYLLEGAMAIPNRVGTAPGQWLDFGRRVLILLPGPPAEMNPMLEDYVLPRLRRLFPSMPRAEAHLHFVGVPESLVDQKIRPIVSHHPDMEFTILAHLGLVDFDIYVSAASPNLAARRLNTVVLAIRRRMGKAFYGMDEDYSLEKVIQESFLNHRATVSVAESCTGGMLAKKLTDVPGSSGYVLGGVVSYSNSAKVSILGVPAPLLRRRGAVSREAASAMARGVRRVFNSTWGVGITGIAGPGGGTPAKPIGLVYVGLSGPKGTRTKEFRLRGSRDFIRRRAVIAGLDMLRQIYL